MTWTKEKKRRCEDERGAGRAGCREEDRERERERPCRCGDSEMGPGRRKRMSGGKGERKSWSIYTCRMIPPGEARMKMRRRMKCKRKERGRRRKGWRVYEI